LVKAPNALLGCGKGWNGGYRYSLLKGPMGLFERLKGLASNTYERISLLVCGLFSKAERTGSPVFHILWLYVLDTTPERLIE
jgi:hypothetical protein